MGNVRAILLMGYLPGLYNSRSIATIYHIVSVFYGLTIVWERETGILKKLLVALFRYATVIGRSIASGVRAVVQAFIIIPVAMLLGVRLCLTLYTSYSIFDIILCFRGFCSYLHFCGICHENKGAIHGYRSGTNHAALLCQ